MWTDFTFCVCNVDSEHVYFCHNIIIFKKTRTVNTPVQKVF